MVKVYIKCNSQGVIPISIISQDAKLEVILLDKDGAPIARYEFDCYSDYKFIAYKSSNSKISFSQTPKMKWEIVSSN